MKERNHVHKKAYNKKRKILMLFKHILLFDIEMLIKKETLFILQIPGILLTKLFIHTAVVFVIIISIIIILQLKRNNVI